MIKQNKKGQMTIWIIVALIIVAIIILLFLLRPKIINNLQEVPNPTSAVDSCVREAVETATKEMLPHGGFISPNNTKMHNDIKVEYICENIGYFKPCINQHPLLIIEMEREINTQITPKIEYCFDNVKQEFENKNYAINMGEINVTVKLKPGIIEVITIKNISATKNEQTTYYSDFKSKIINPSYDLARIAQEIADQEAKYCYFEYVGYSILYPRYKITVTRYSDLTKVYNILDKQTNKEMNIAIRGCAIPAGL